VFNIFKTDKTILRQLVSLAIPMVISQGAFALMIFSDRYFLSLISPTHMSAGLGGGVAAFFCLSLFIGLLSYGNALVAQYFGADKKELCPKVLSQGFILAVACMPVLALMAYGFGNVFAVMGHDAQQVPLETTYFNVLMWGAIFALLKTCIASYFSGIGRTKVVMIADLLGVGINIPLSYGLIFGEFGLPEWGIKGAAVGTIISNLISLLLFLYYYFEEKHRLEFSVAQSFSLNKKILKRYLRLGLPSGFEMFLNVAAFNLFILMFQSFGVTQGASAAIVLNWDIVSYVPMLGLHIAIISLIGRFVGANQPEKISSVISSGFLLGIGYSAILGILFVVFRDPLVAMFVPKGSDGEEIQTLASWMMWGMASYVIADAIILVASGVLRGVGDTRWLMITSTFVHWVMAIAQYMVIKVFAYGPEVSWIIFVSMIITLAIVFTWRLQKQQWREPEVLERMMQR
jgi:MATE family multidrug resistance protein